MSTSIRFIHCSDLHLGGKFLGVGQGGYDISEKLAVAAYEALDRIVEKANSEAVDFVLFAGDIFDSGNETPYARSKFVQALAKINCPCYICYGNHDYKRLWGDCIPLPPNAHVFSSIVEKKYYPSSNPYVCITGISHSKSVHSTSLTKDFIPEKGMFNIGLVHCDVNSSEDKYAPVSLSELIEKGYDYWALGHIHKTSILSSSPAVIYPGCTQGMNIKESGPKGAYLITVADGVVVRKEFFRTCSIEWVDSKVIIDSTTDLPSMISLVSKGCEPGSIVRITVTGSGPLNSKLRLYPKDVIQLFEETTGCICYGMDVRSLPEINLEERAKSGDFAATVLEYSKSLSATFNRDLIIDMICSTSASARLRPMFESMESDELRRLVEKATGYIVERIREAEE